MKVTRTNQLMVHRIPRRNALEEVAREQRTVVFGTTSDDSEKRKTLGHAIQYQDRLVTTTNNTKQPHVRAGTYQCNRLVSFAWTVQSRRFSRGPEHQQSRTNMHTHSFFY